MPFSVVWNGAEWYQMKLNEIKHLECCSALLLSSFVHIFAKQNSIELNPFFTHTVGQLFVTLENETVASPRANPNL